MPSLPYPITGTVKDSRNNLLIGITVTLKNTTKSSNGLPILTDSNGKYTADAANFNTGYDLNDSVSVEAYNSFKDEYALETFTIIGSSKTQDLNLSVINSLQKGITGYQEKVIITNVHSNPYTSDNRFPVETNDPLEKYVLTDQDVATNTQYYGFTDRFGNWYIRQEAITGGIVATRYARGSSDYTTNWTNRTALSYGYFYDIF